MSRSDTWTAEWCCDKLISHENILDAIPTSGNTVRLAVKDISNPVLIVTMSEHRVELNAVPDLLHDSEIEFLLNIPKDAYFSGELLSIASGIPIGIGGIRDLYTAAAEKQFRTYIPKETRFILRGLVQHSAVREVVRINSRSYQILKHSGETLCVLALNEYDLTADAVRSGLEKYGKPDFVLASNPNCRLTVDTIEAARFAGTGVLIWRQLLGVLNN